MHVLVINYEYPPLGGGGGFVTRDIFEHIATLGHSVTILTSHFTGLKKHEIVNGVEIIRIPVLFRKKLEVASLPSMLSYFPSSILNAASRLRGHYFDIINTHFAIPSGPSGYFIGKLWRRPNILSIHGGDIYDPSKTLSPHKTPLLSGTVRFMLNKADRVVAQSRNTQHNAASYYRVSRPIAVIPLGIKKPSFSRKKREDFGLPSNALIFAVVGRLVSRKNIGDTLKVLANMRASLDFFFLIIGDGPQRISLENEVHLSGLNSHVRFTGTVSDEEKFQLLSLSDIYLSTSDHEGFGLVYLEAMECGLPIICYDNGGQTDFLDQGRNGFLVPLGNRQQFHAKLLELVENQGLRHFMGTNNKKEVQNYYISRCAEQYLTIFQEEIERHMKAGK